MGLAILFFFGFFLVFSRFFDTFGQKPKNLEKTKKTKSNKIPDPNSPACAYMGLAILFFFWFLEVFLEKTKKNKIADPNSPACAYMGLAIFVFLFFFGFLEVF